MKIILHPAITLDGFIADANGNSDYVTEQDGELFEAEVKKAGCTIVGMTTFQQYKDEIYPIGNTTTYVVTSKAGELKSTDKIKYVLPDAAKICEQIAKDGFETTLLSGSGETNGLFAAANLIDEAIVSVYPLVLGSGIKMFGSYIGQIQLDLISTKQLDGGVVQNRYIKGASQ